MTSLVTILQEPNQSSIIFGKSERIESYLRHTLEVYENSLNRKKRKTMAQEKVLRPQSWLECNVFSALPTIHVVDSGVQTEEIAHDYEEENNRRVVNELKVLSHHLLDYNRRTFGKFQSKILVKIMRFLRIYINNRFFHLSI